jgi:hypothetical protein
MAEQIVNPASAAQLKPRNSEPTHLSGNSWDDLGGRSWDGPAGPEGYKVDASKGVKGKDTSIPASVAAEPLRYDPMRAEEDDKDVEIEFGDEKHEATDVDDLDKALDEADDLPAAKVDVKTEDADGDTDTGGDEPMESEDDDKDVKEDDDEKKDIAEARRFARALRIWEEAEDDEEKKNEAEDDEKDVAEAEDDEKDVKEDEDEKKDIAEEEDDKPAFLKKKDDDEKNEAEEDEKDIHESLKIRIKMPSTTIFESAGFDSKQQKRMAAIFESAVKQTTKQVSKQIHEHYRKAAAASIRRNERLLENRLSTYLDVVTEEWMKTNKVAVRQSLRADLSENFLNGLQRLFKEHYIDVPASKVDVVKALTREVEGLKQQVNEQHTQKLKLRRLAEAANKKRIVAEFSRTMSESQAAKLDKLAEDTEYLNAKDFREKLAMLKESYFDKRPSSMARLPEEDVQVLKENVNSKSEADLVADAITRQSKTDW